MSLHIIPPGFATLQNRGELIQVAPLVYIGKSKSSLDPAVAKFIAKSGVNATAPQIAALNTRVLAAKGGSNPYWSALSVYYPFLGNSATCDSFNLVDADTFQITWSGTVTHDANGITGDGSSGQGDTTLNPSTIPAFIDSLAFGFYNRTTGSNGASEFGVLSGSEAAFIVTNTSNFNLSINCGGASFAATPITPGTEIGLQSDSRTSSANHIVYQRSTAIATATSIQDVIPNATFILLNVPTQGFSSRNLASAYVGTGLTAAQIAQFNTDEQVFQTSLSRQV